MRRASFFLVLSCAIVLSCRRQENTAAPTGEDAGAAWATTRDALIEEYLKTQPAFAVYQGRHEFDGRLPDWSADGIAAEVKRLQALLDSESALRRQIVKEIEADAKLYGDDRRTLIEAADRASVEIRVVEEPVTVIVSEKGWVRARQGHGHDPSQFSFKSGDAFYGAYPAMTSDALYAIEQLSLLCHDGERSDFLVGGDVTLADIMLLPIAGYLMVTPEGREAIHASTRLARWWVVASRRAAWARAKPPQLAGRDGGMR